VLAAWDKVDGVLAKAFGLDESKYQWAIEAHRLQEKQVLLVLALLASCTQAQRARRAGSPPLLQEREAREMEMQAREAAVRAAAEAVRSPAPVRRALALRMGRVACIRRGRVQVMQVNLVDGELSAGREAPLQTPASGERSWALGGRRPALSPPRTSLPTSSLAGR
jgi:hypothetical protein